MPLPILIAILCLAATARGEAIEQTLDNGLTVLLESAEGGAKAAIILTIDAGEIDDPPGRSGMAHLVEHLVCTAAAGEQPAMAVEAFFGRYGNQANAQTGRDYTVFAGVVASDAVSAEIAWWAERLEKLAPVQADFDREIPRMELELANMYGGMPALAAANLAQNLADPLPGDHRKGGRPEAIRTVTIEEARAWYAGTYRPGAITLSIAGTFDIAAARAAAMEHMGRLDAGERPALAPEPAASEPGPAEVRRPGPGPAVAARVYRAADPTDAAYAPMLVFANRLMQAAQSAGRQPVPSIQFSPLDNPRVLVVMSEIDKRWTPAQIKQQLDAVVRDALTRPLAGGEGSTVLMNLGFLIGARPLPPMLIARNPYLAAFVNARSRQMKIDRTALTTALQQMTEATYRAFVDEWLPATPQGEALVVPE